MRPGSKPPSSVTVPAVDEAPARSRDRPRRFAVGSSRTVITLSAAVGIDDRIRPGGRGRRPTRSSRALGRMKLPRTRPVMRSAVLGRDRNLHPHAAGASGTSHCHPIQSSVNPWRISAPSPNSASVVGSAEPVAFWKVARIALGAAVADFVEQAAVAARGIDRLQQVEVGARIRPRRAHSAARASGRRCSPFAGAPGRARSRPCRPASRRDRRRRTGGRSAPLRGARCGGGRRVPRRAMR